MEGYLCVKSYSAIEAREEVVEGILEFIQRLERPLAKLGSVGGPPSRQMP